MVFGVGVAPAREEPRSGSSSSGHESTSSRSTNYGSGHPIRVFRGIGRIVSLLFLLSHPSPIGHLLRRVVQSRSRNMVSSEAKNGFNCVSCGTFRERGRAPFAKTRTPRAPKVPHGTSGTSLTGHGSWKPAALLLCAVPKRCPGFGGAPGHTRWVVVGWLRPTLAI